MSFFDKFKFSSGGPKVSDAWNHPQTEDEVRAAFATDLKPQFIYKHSFACYTCTLSLLDLEKQLDAIKEKADVHFIDVRASRPLSKLAAELSGVQHESPQAILLYKGEAFWHDSHSGVRAGAVLDALNEI
ncbi:MAG: thioredoxin family protein [Balneolia bacterium]|nr:thioredoxin family protein [Balneolia bacterium]